MNAINMPNVSAEEAPILVPYMALASRLGSFLGQVTRNELKSVSIELDGAAANLNTDPIIIYGHTDTKGSKKYNLILSDQRALSVSKYFRKKGINNKLIIKSYGEDYPLIITGDNVEEENNRRVEVIINN